MKLVILVCAVAAAQAGNKPRYYDLNKAPELFAKFMKDYNKQYKNAEDTKVHYEAFLKSLIEINHSNMDNPTAIFGIDNFADYTDEERSHMHGYYKP